MSRAGTIVAVLLALSAAPSLLAIDPERDFSGRWILVSGAGGSLLTVTENDSAILCGDGQAQWRIALNGSETRYHLGQEQRNSIAKWEGAALLVNTLVSGPGDYTIMDRWILSRDRHTLTITRQIVTAAATTESTLVYQREGFTAPAPPSAPPPQPHPRPALTRQTPPPAPSELTVPAGTHIALALRNTVDTRHSHDGDHIYLETAAPISVGGRIVVPSGSYVNGTVTASKAAGTLKGKGELFIRFDALILPNGVTREFRSRLASSDAPSGKVDPKEGKVTGERDTSGEARGAAEGGAIGAGVGGIAGGAAGHPITGLGVGATAGAAVGLASVMVKHRPDAALPRGTIVEMILDRDLHFDPAELSFR